jgi:hypothetical protein
MRLRGRHPLRRLLLGAGPLKRTTDRLHALSRVLVLLAVLAAVPAGVAVGAAVAGALHGTVHAQAATHIARTATLLTEAPVVSSPDGGDVLAPAQWRGPHGRLMTGEVSAPSGDPAGSAVTIWVDRAGRLTGAPLSDEDIAAQSITAGIVAALAVPVLVLLAHLGVVRLLDRARLRRWTAEWASVEPLWAGRTH